MQRWAARLMLVLLLVVFALVMTMLHKQLVALQKQQQQHSGPR